MLGGSLLLCGLFSSCGEWGLLASGSCVQAPRVVAPLVAERRFCGLRASIAAATGH